MLAVAATAFAVGVEGFATQKPATFAVRQVCVIVPSVWREGDISRKCKNSVLVVLVAACSCCWEERGMRCIVQWGSDTHGTKVTATTGAVWLGPSMWAAVSLSFGMICSLSCLRSSACSHFGFGRIAVRVNTVLSTTDGSSNELCRRR